ncbi:MAG: 2-C-methyl-D-erythritol 4-phosphate cytidylyltransferase [Lentisphaerae bacterium GWF2_45_14]|nr:MAG: 2-C-methyl-D-erythritol 4-phosphate cytidylyltransferase [Lentisphaerae bacterium GWF2_45_14]
MKSDKAVIIAAGGSGRRFGEQNKLFEMLGNMPVFLHSVKNFLEVCPPENIIISAPPEEKERFIADIDKYLYGKDFKIVPGGSERMISVKNALDILPENIKYVAVHDAARPLAPASLLMECFRKAEEHGGAVAAKPVTDTIKRADSEQFIVETLNRSELWAMETPQVFNLALFREAYENALEAGKIFTDDAGIMEFSGHRVFLVVNPFPNIKITYASDIVLAESFSPPHSTL